MSSGAPSSNSPLHQKILDFEAKLVRWNILPERSANPRTARPQRPGCMSTPLPRKPTPSLGLPCENGNFGGGSAVHGSAKGIMRKRMKDGWHGPHINHNNAHAHQQNRHSDSAEVQRRLEEIMKQTGVLKIDGKMVQCDCTELVLLGELGQGTCGHVVKMKHPPTDTVMAIKQMRRTGNKEENKRVIMDLDVVLRSHECPYIVKCLGCFITDSEVWICMELMATCLDKLSKRLKGPIEEKILGKMAVSVLKALNYLKEEQGIIHRDVKPSNMLLDWSGTIKLCDFGISGKLVDSRAKTRTAGCAAYMAPERIDPPDPSRPDYDIRADVWSLGISIVELATGKFPYSDCASDFEVLSKILEADPPIISPDDPPGFSPQLCSFVTECLAKDYKKRPKYKKLLEHPFIKRYETENVDVAAWFKQIHDACGGHVTPSPDANLNVASLAEVVEMTRL